MAKKETTQSYVTISKEKSYDKHKVILNLDAERTEKFNKGEKIEVTEQELNTIGKHRWVEVVSVTEDIS